MGLARGVISARQHNRFDGTIQFGDGDLQGHLHRMEAEVTLLPFLCGLEHQRQRHHVGAVELFQRFNCLGVILPSRASHQSKTSERHDAVHKRLLRVDRVIEEGIHGSGKIQPAAEDRYHPRSAILQLLDRCHVVGIVTGDDVTALQHQANHRSLAGLLAEITAAGGPVQILLEVLEHGGCQGMPDPEVRENLRLSHLHLRARLTLRDGEDIFVRQHQQEIAQVVWCSPQPVLKAEHEAARVLRLLHGQIFENRWQGVQQFEHGVLKTGTTGFLPLLHEAGNGAFALAKLGHGEAAELVEPHHLGHRGEHHGGLELVPMGSHRFNNFLSQIFDEDQ